MYTPSSTRKARPHRAIAARLWASREAHIRHPHPGVGVRASRMPPGRDAVAMLTAPPMGETRFVSDRNVCTGSGEGGISAGVILYGPEPRVYTAS